MDSCNPWADLDVAAAEPAGELLVVVAGDGIGYAAPRRRPWRSAAHPACAGRDRRGRRRKRACARRRGDGHAAVPQIDHIADPHKQLRSSSAQPWMSPMMSNGPRSSRRSVHSGLRSIAAASISATEESRHTCRKPSRARPRSPLRISLIMRCGTGAEGAIGPRLVARDADIESRIEHDRDRQRVPAPGGLDPDLALGRPHIGCIDDGQPPVLETFLGNRPHEVECVARYRLVVAHRPTQSAALVRRNDFGRQEPARGEGRLAGARRADQHDEGEVRDVQYPEGARRSSREHRHLAGCAELGMSVADAASATGSRSAPRSPRPTSRTRRGSTRSGGPGGGGCRPAASRTARCSRVGCRHDHGLRAGGSEHDALDGRQAVRIEMLDDLHQRRRVDLVPAGVAVGEGAMQQRDAPRRAARLVQAAAARRRPPASATEASSPMSLGSGGRAPGAQQLALAAAEVGHDSAPEDAALPPRYRGAGHAGGSALRAGPRGRASRQPGLLGFASSGASRASASRARWRRR